jgi:alpha-1,6-mannosyltransferase
VLEPRHQPEPARHNRAERQCETRPEIFAQGSHHYVPADPQLEALRDPDIFPKINRAATAVTIYFPAAEAIFLAVTRVSESVTAMKAAMVGFEIITFGLLACFLAGRPCPSGVSSFTRGTAAVVGVCRQRPYRRRADCARRSSAVGRAARQRRARGAFPGGRHADKVISGGSAACSLSALGRGHAAFAVTIVAGYLTFIGVGWQVFGFLPGYAGEEGFDAGGVGF